MIKANEVRVGNYLKFIVEKTIVKISGSSNDGDKDWIYLIKSEHLYQDVSTNIFEPYLSIHFEPIPLTPEILDKAGFVPTEHGSSFPIGESTEIALDLDDTEDFIYNVFIIQTDVYNKKDNIFLRIEVNSLHQLQNLYFALTGEELPIEL